MRKHIQMAVFLFSVVSIRLCYADQGEKEHVMTRAMTVTVEQVSLQVVVVGKCIAGEGITCEILMTNAGNKAIWYGHVTEYNDFRIDIKDASGTNVALTRFGNNIFGGDPEEHKAYCPEKLMPGQTLMRRYNLSRFFDLTLSGDYTITVSREINEIHGGDYLVLKVEGLRFRVLD